MQLTSTVGVPTPVSAMLYEAVQFAVAVAEETGGAFDPTVGYEMESRGFNREYSTGRVVRTPLEPDGPVSYRDLRLDPNRRTVTLLRPLILDLGAVAKGLAVDTAARELQPLENFAIDAGGDLYLGGRNPAGEAWAVGIRHPRLSRSADRDASRVGQGGLYIGRLRAAGRWRMQPHHRSPYRANPPTRSASVTVVAPTAMLADAVATAAFVLGPTEGIESVRPAGR